MLAKLRKKIDRIDRKMLALFEARLGVAKQVGDYKKERNLPIFVPEREEEVIKNRVAKLKNPAYADLTKGFFSSLMSLSRHLQQEGMDAVPASAAPIPAPKVAYLGRPGSNSAEALSRLFPDASEAIPADSFDAIFDALKSGTADYGILPIENTQTGAINDVLDLLYKNNLFIVREGAYKIEYVLAAPSGAQCETIKTVYSHPQALLQCNDFLKTLGATTCPMQSTADSGAFVAEKGDITTACVVNPGAAELFGLSVLAKDIETSAENTTRFIAISANMETSPDADIVSLAFTLRHESGSLYHALSVFAQFGMNLLYLQSRPLPGRNFEYMFFADFAGNLSGADEQKVLSGLREHSADCRVLGNYPSGRGPII